MPRTIVMIHGMFGGSWYWENFRRFFEAQGYHCIAPILRYHDMDPRDEPDLRLGTTSLLDYAADLETLIRELEEPPIVLGHSMGGLLAQILGSRGVAKALVLLTPASPAGILALRFSVLKTFREALFRPGFWKKPQRPSYELAVYGMLHLLPEAQQKEIYNRFVYESGRAAAEIGFWLFDPHHASRVDETKITCPMLVLGAKEDRATPAAVVRKVARKYRRVATYKEFANHAHWLLAEPGWEEVAGEIVKWLTDNGF